MILDGSGTDMKTVCNLNTRLPFSHHLKHFALAAV